MNDYVFAGIFMTAVIIYVAILLYIAFKIDDKHDIEPLLWIYGHIIFTLICILFILGEVPYIITTWLVVFGGMLSYALYLDVKD